jgi:protein FAM50
MASSSSSSIHTVEGNVAGSRAAQLERKRQQDLEAFEQRKRQIHDEGSGSLRPMAQKFAPASTTKDEMHFRIQTVGLVSVADYSKAAASAAAGSGAAANKKSSSPNDPDAAADPSDQPPASEEERARQLKAEKKARKARLKEKKKMLSTLSFANNDDEVELPPDEEEGDDPIRSHHPTGSGGGGNKRARVQKDSTVDTSFLPDPERDERILREKRRLEDEWRARQEVVRQERLEITYSYWDGSGHRRLVTVRKGNTIGEFLELVRKDLCREFRELANVSSDALLYVKEDLIVPSDMTFYDLIVTKARGKSGPLFHFDVHDDVRTGAIDSRIEKDESHPGKVVERRWYERNKHIFPASRWEMYDPAADYGSYTIGDRASGGR